MHIQIRKHLIRSLSSVFGNIKIGLVSFYQLSHSDAINIRATRMILELVLVLKKACDLKFLNDLSKFDAKELIFASTSKYVKMGFVLNTSCNTSRRLVILLGKGCFKGYPK